MAVWQQFFQVSELFSQNLGKNVYLPLEHGRILDILLATNIGVSIGLTMGLYYSLCGWCIQIYPDISCRSAIHWMISSHFWDGGSRICFNNSISGLAGRSPLLILKVSSPSSSSGCSSAFGARIGDFSWLFHTFPVHGLRCCRVHFANVMSDEHRLTCYH